MKVSEGLSSFMEYHPGQTILTAYTLFYPSTAECVPLASTIPESCIYYLLPFKQIGIQVIPVIHDMQK